MSTSRQVRPRGSAVQFIQALSSLAFLFGFYLWSTTSDASGISLRSAPPKPQIFTAKYWDDKLGYGFESQKGDTFSQKSLSGITQVSISAKNGEVYRDDHVRVSFYPGETVSKIREKIGSRAASAYAQLDKGVAVVEGDLDSERAKMILATLHDL